MFNPTLYQIEQLEYHLTKVTEPKQRASMLQRLESLKLSLDTSPPYAPLEPLSIISQDPSFTKGT
jgi:hypothetical protein